MKSKIKFSHFVLCLIFLPSMNTLGAAERLYIQFELSQKDVVINRGNDHATHKPHSWNRGLSSSYLRLRCEQVETGKFKKMYSLVDHFSGLRVTHRLVEDSIEVTVYHSVVQNRRAEIHDLPKHQCRELAPIVTVVKETYNFPAKTGLNEVRKFGENMNFRLAVKSVGKIDSE